MASLRVAIVTLHNPLEKTFGGIESVVYNLSIALAKLGVETWVLCMGNVKKPTITKKRNVNFWILPDNGYKNILTRSFLFLIKGKKVIKEMEKKLKINIFNGQAGFCAPLVFSSLEKAKKIITIHTHDDENIANIIDCLRTKHFKEAFLEILKLPLLKFWRYIYYSRCEALIFASEYTFRTWKIFYPFVYKKNHIIENGCPNFINKKNVKKESDFIYVGRIDKRKGVDLLIKAIHLLKKSEKKLPIVYVVGDGKWKNELENLSKKLNLKNILFFGYQNYNSTLNLISKSRFLLLPSNYESCPLVIGEAMALGTPPIVSDIPALKKMVSNGKNGFIFEKNNIEDLSKMIKKAMNIKKDRYLIISRNARASVKDKNWMEIAKKYVSVYNSLINQK